MAVTQLDIQPVLIEQVENRLIDAIVDGTLVSGSRVTQESVAEMLGVSRQPVSHALQALKRRGLLIEHGKRGLAIAPLDAERLRNLYQVRAALDELAARLAADRVRSGEVCREPLAQAQSSLMRGQTLTQAAALGQRIACDVAFHSALYVLSGNTAIGETVGAQWPHFMRSMVVVLDDIAMRTRVWDEHAAILDAIMAGNAAAAGQRARRHTEDAGDETARRLEVRAR
jgi:DNA-binding GntR family transcriptional regulator